MQSGGPLDVVTGNVVFALLVLVLSAAVIVPVARGTLTQEAMTNIAIASLGSLATMAAMAAGWHWRGKIQSPENGATTTVTTEEPTDINVTPREPREQ